MHKRRASYRWRNEGKQGERKSMLSCALYHGIFITTSWKCIRRKAHEEIISTLGDIQHKKGAPHITWEIVMLCLSKPKKKGKKRTYYCYCCRVCCKSEWTERATTSRAIVGLLRYVMCTKVIWLITLPLCLAVWKGDRSNLNSIEWIFFAGALFFIYYMMYYGFAFVSGSRTYSFIYFSSGCSACDRL